MDHAVVSPNRGTGTGSFSIAPANTYGGYYGAGTYSSPPAEAGASSASFTVWRPSGVRFLLTSGNFLHSYGKLHFLWETGKIVISTEPF